MSGEHPRAVAEHSVLWVFHSNMWVGRPGPKLSTLQKCTLRENREYTDITRDMLEGLLNASLFSQLWQSECNKINPHFCPEQQEIRSLGEIYFGPGYIFILETMKDCKLWLNSQHLFKQLSFKTILCSAAFLFGN